MAHDLSIPFLSGIKERSDELIISHSQYVGDIYSFNKYLRSKTDEMWGKGGEMKQVASIPLVEYIKLEKMGLTPEKDKNAFARAIECHPEWKTTTKRII